MNRAKGIFLIFTVISMVLIGAGTSSAATWDATGDWSIQTSPVQILGYTIPPVFTNIEITQYINDTFSFVSDSIAEMGGIVYSGSGTISGALYTFVPMLTESVNMQSFDPGFPDQWVTVTLAGFTLNSATTLSGQFDLSLGILTGAIPFEGQKAAVPIPGAVYLLASGIIGLVGVRKKFTPAS